MVSVGFFSEIERINKETSEEGEVISVWLPVSLNRLFIVIHCHICDRFTLKNYLHSFFERIINRVKSFPAETAVS